MHSSILHYTIHSTTQIALLYHPESNPLRVTPLTFPSPSKSILSDYLKLQDNRSTILIYVSLTYSIQFNPLHSFQPIRLIQFHSTRPEILFRSLHTSLIITPNKKRERVFSTNTLSLKIITLFQWLPYVHHSLCYSKTKLI
jgi:hypothetical protein